MTGALKQQQSELKDWYTQTAQQQSERLVPSNSNRVNDWSIQTAQQQSELKDWYTQTA